MTLANLKTNARIVIHLPFHDLPTICTITAIKDDGSVRAKDEQSNALFTIPPEAIKEVLGDVLVPWDSYADYLLGKKIPVTFPGEKKRKSEQERAAREECREKEERKSQLSRITAGMNAEEITELLIKLQEGI